MRIKVIAFSRRGCELAEKISNALKEHECSTHSKTSADHLGTEALEGPTSKWTEESFRTADAIVYIGAAGIAVRYIAPFMKNKTVDPAIISVDERGEFVIPLLSGHIGGANDLAKEIAESICAIPVITTATDIHGRFSVDTFAVKNDMHIGNMSLAKKVSSLIVDDKKVGFISYIQIKGTIPPELDMYNNEETGILVSYGREEGPFKRTLKLTPRCHIIGIGCRRGTQADKIEDLVHQILEKENISIKSVKGIASIDLKKDEEGLLEFSRKIQITPTFFTSDELAALPDMNFTSSERVRSVTGVDNVCERSAIAASKNGEIVVRKTSKDGVTVAIAREPVELDMMRR